MESGLTPFISAWKKMLKQPNLFEQGFHITSFPLPEKAKDFVQHENWPLLDECFQTLTSPGGDLFNFLHAFHDFSAIEFIISIRDANNDWEEDGIWHDDGSRVFAFSLSLTTEEVEGGKLGVRRKGEKDFTEIKTPPYGEVILFLTGKDGYEHKIHQVTKGRRIIIAGWCS
jgi:hypothetical protein